VIEAGVGQRLEERPRKLALCLDLVGGAADLGRELPRGLEQRSRPVPRHGDVPAPCPPAVRGHPSIPDSTWARPPCFPPGTSCTRAARTAATNLAGRVT